MNSGSSEVSGRNSLFSLSLSPSSPFANLNPNKSALSQPQLVALKQTKAEGARKKKGEEKHPTPENAD